MPNSSLGKMKDRAALNASTIPIPSEAIVLIIDIFLKAEKLILFLNRFSSEVSILSISDLLKHKILLPNKAKIEFILIYYTNSIKERN